MPHCCYCKRQLTHPSDRSKTAATRDHVMPKVLGGGRTVPCCRQCNGLKADLDPSLWRVFTEEYPRWWKNFHSSKAVRLAAIEAMRDRVKRQCGAIDYLEAREG
jgi:5-methylcytosine-specific restriction endonuclease McrA